MAGSFEIDAITESGEKSMLSLHCCDCSKLFARLIGATMGERSVVP